jgi:predicted DNA-binding transcriptional regulator AlpA
MTSTDKSLHLKIAIPKTVTSPLQSQTLENREPIASTATTEVVREADVQTPIVVSLTPLLLTTKQVGLVVGISERKLRAMVSARRFPKPVRGLGRIARWRRSDVETWVASLS